MKEEHDYNIVKSNVDYLKENISIDDIYLFADQSISAAAHLLAQLCDKKRLKEKTASCEITNAALLHIYRFSVARSENKPYSFGHKLEDLKKEV